MTCELCHDTGIENFGEIESYWWAVDLGERVRRPEPQEIPCRDGCERSDEIDSD